MRGDVPTHEPSISADAGMPAPFRPDLADFTTCLACRGEGAVSIEPIHDDGAIWMVMPCELCEGTGVLRCERWSA